MVDICWPGPGHFPTQVLQNSAHAQNCLERPCGSVLWQSGTHKSQERYQHKLEQRSRNTSVLWQSGTRKCPEWYQQILEYHSRNTSVLWQSGTRKCPEWYQQILEYHSRNISVFWQSGTPTPFGIYNIIKGGTSTTRPTDCSITSQTTLYWGPVRLTGKQLPNESARHPLQHLQPILRKTNVNQN